MNIETVNQIVSLFIVIFIGYFIRKIELIDDYTNKKLVTLVIYIALPMLIITSMVSDEVNLKMSDVYTLMMITLCIYTFLVAMTFVVPKILKVQQGNIGVYKFMVVFSNVAFVAYPILAAIYGDIALFYASILNLPFNFLLFTVGIYFMSIDEGKDHQFELKKPISPAIIASIIGLVMFALNLSLPPVVAITFRTLGSLTTPLSMIVIGSSLVHANLAKVIKDWRLISLCAIKQLVFPLIVYSVLKIAGFEGMMLTVPTLLTGMPIASNTVIIAIEYGGNSVVASEGVILSTLSSLGTLAILISIII